MFSAYSRPESFLGCGCCFEDEALVAETGWNDTDRPIVRIDAPGGTRPLQDVTAEDLEYIVADLILTCGDVGVLKHYLARLLEITATDHEWDGDPEIVIGKLSLGPDVKRDALVGVAGPRARRRPPVPLGVLARSGRRDN